MANSVLEILSYRMLPGWLWVCPTMGQQRPLSKYRFVTWCCRSSTGHHANTFLPFLFSLPSSEETWRRAWGFWRRRRRRDKACWQKTKMSVWHVSTMSPRNMVSRGPACRELNPRPSGPLDRICRPQSQTLRCMLAGLHQCFPTWGDWLYIKITKTSQFKEIKLCITQFF